VLCAAPHHPRTMIFVRLPPLYPGGEVLSDSIFILKENRVGKSSTGLSFFLGALGVTLALWGLRGIGLLIFLPSVVIWVPLLVTIAIGMVNTIRWTRY